ncbi:MAG: hypothetical protein JWP13_64 [Candidatus Saccharibacteria bacterium]|nr:hypothetical protein [Candidatus Saccharibacteria bacterium]
MQHIKIEPCSAIDAHWHGRLCEITEGISETFLLLEPDQKLLEQEREAFFASGCSSNPNLRPRYLDKGLFEKAKQGLVGLRTDIDEQELNEYIREAYHAHISDYITGLEMLLAVAAGDQELFIKKNVQLYGEPDANVFSAICAWLREDITTSVDSAVPELASLRDEVLRVLPYVEGGEVSLLLPPKEVFAKVRDMHFIPGGYFDQLFAPSGLSGMPYIEQKHGDEITRQAIANVGSDYTIKSATDGLWAVLTRSRQVVRPLGYRVDRDYFAGVIAHEVGSHLLEEANGSRQPLKLLALGLNGFEKGNEGRAYLREQIVYEDESVLVHQPSWEYILALHLGVSLASGQCTKPYTFAQLYEVFLALHTFWRARRYPMDTNNAAQAAEESWLLAVRIMKGTDGSGGCYMKDTVYLEGNINCWKLAEKMGPKILLQGDIGKFNITDERHCHILKGLGILQT